jgi:hypothetical protein
MFDHHDFLPEAGGSTLLRSVNKFLRGYTAQSPRFMFLILTVFVVFGKLLGPEALKSRVTLRITGV